MYGVLAKAWTLDLEVADSTSAQFLVALELPRGGYWLGHVETYGWPPTNQSNRPKLHQ